MMFEHVLFLSVYLFSIGIYGLITSRNMVRALICLELILNSINLNLVTFSDLFDSRQLKGDIFAIFVIALAAAEAAIGLSILSSIHRNGFTSRPSTSDRARRKRFGEPAAGSHGRSPRNWLPAFP